MLRYLDACMITNPRYQRHVLEVAGRAGIPVQTSVREGGGTDGGPVHQLDVPCVVSGVPSRYIHAGCSICALDDVKASAALAVEVCGGMTRAIADGF